MKGLIYNTLFGFNDKYHSYTTIGYIVLLLFLTNQANTTYALLFWFCFSFALNTGARLQSENQLGWDRYELTLPVSKSQIIGAKFISYTLLLLRNIAEVFVVYVIISMLNRLPFQPLLISLLFGAAVALLIGTYIHPAYLMQKEKESSELLINSLLFTTIILFIVWKILEYNNETINLISFPTALVAFSTSVVTFILSYFISAFYYKNQNLWR